MERSNIGSAASLEDLVELLDRVSFGSATTTNNNASDWVSQNSKIECIDNASNDDEDSADSGIRKDSSYPIVCANKSYLARHQVCMVDITRIDGELEDVTDEEEEWDEHGNPKFYPARLNMEGRITRQAINAHHSNALMEPTLMAELTSATDQRRWNRDSARQCGARAREASSGSLTRILEQCKGRYRT
jgi:hypothetical protein